ncbi:hypothetical protein SAMN06296427_108156 [Moheibacter sediminis]|uniref:Uncharacterized protein n=1 Tax=Moheibacter sediminis TaxID=1434700 RepID=A0A1W2C5C2_9FLAO|nr:hypothetical protein SAMN06296427_108156 [Moheibacter sediminis]
MITQHELGLNHIYNSDVWTYLKKSNNNAII